MRGRRARGIRKCELAGVVVLWIFKFQFGL